MAYGAGPEKKSSKKSGKKADLRVERAHNDLKRAYEAKRALIKREKEDHLFALGDQWSAEDKAALERAGIKPVVDNRIAPNLFLLTGLERQNRSEFRAFPEGEEDGLKAEIASLLFKDIVKKSGFLYKSSEQFKDGITCGESHIELYLDYTESLLNGKPCWAKCDGSAVIPDPASREYDYSDARFIYKLKLDVSEGDLINLFPEKKAIIQRTSGGKLNLDMESSDGVHRQPKDYGTQGSSDYRDDSISDDSCFDLVERYYKKWVESVFIGDKKTGEIKPAESLEAAEQFISDYRDGIAADQLAYADALNQFKVASSVAEPSLASPAPEDLPGTEELGPALVPGEATPAPMGAPMMAPPPPPPPQDPDRFILIRRQVPEIWYFAYVPGMEEPLADERAWFYPKWKSYPIIPYFARFSTAPLTGDDRHLLVQGLVHGVKGVQEKHNKAEMLMIRHLNTTTNSGWLVEEDTWVDTDAVKNLGTAAGVNLEYKTGKQKPERIQPMPLSTGHAAISTESAESIKAQLGINADLLATQQGGSDSGRAIALRQKQGLLMVQELFDNHSRTRQLAGRFLLTQLGEIHDVESAKKVLGDAFLKKNFPPLMLTDPLNPSAPPTPQIGPDGVPMVYDTEMAEVAIAEVLSGDLWNYDVSVGEAVASETQRMSVASDIKDIATAFPGLVPPDVLVRHSQLPESAKTEIFSAIAKQQAMAMGPAGLPAPIGGTPGPAK